MKVLITRPEPSATATAEKLLSAGHTPVVFPMSKRQCMKITTQDNLHLASAFIFTSANAIHCFKDTVLLETKLLEKTIYVVGNKTKETAIEIGFTDVRVGAGNGKALAELIIEEYKAKKTVPSANNPLIYLTAENRTPNLEETLAKHKLFFTSIIVYEMVSKFLQMELNQVLENDVIDVVLFYSQSAVRRFFAAITDYDSDLFTSLRYGCLSKEIAAAIPDEFSNQIDIAIEPREHHLLASIGN